jgi:hypothetical protein
MLIFVGPANLSLANQSQFLLLGLPSLSRLEGQVREKLGKEEIDICVSGVGLTFFANGPKF